MVFKRMLFIAIIVIVINAILISPIYAMGNIISSGQSFLQKGDPVVEVINTSSLEATSNFIYNLFLVVAIVLAVGVGTVLGIKFITSSVEGQAKIKEAIIPYIVGCIVIFAAFPIWSFIVDAGQYATGTRVGEGDNGSAFIHVENSNCSEVVVAKEKLIAQRQFWSTLRVQCRECWNITVYDVYTYQGELLKWAQCAHCSEDLQLDLEALKGDNEKGEHIPAETEIIVECYSCKNWTMVYYVTNYKMEGKGKIDKGKGGIVRDHCPLLYDKTN